ncbi:hypothetical protein HY501_01325 [Candidatus Woesearchaeota archaeon]|nr:hypothetical protein [Candidatus Woesearchaeota archaeon]
MNKANLLIFGLPALIIGILLLLYLNQDVEYSTQTSTGEVTIDLTPKGEVNGNFLVGVSVNTHSVALEGYDLAKLTRLEIKGQSIQPTSAPALTGHHVSGELIFPLQGSPKTFKIIIVKIPDKEIREFVWE